jgi:hypothetical protein
LSYLSISLKRKVIKKLQKKQRQKRRAFHTGCELYKLNKNLARDKKRVRLPFE